MSKDKNNDRRQFLRCGLTMTVAGLAATQARAQAPAKATQEQAHYEDHADSATCAEWKGEQEASYTTKSKNSLGFRSP